jgi:hypothetical protein
LGFWIREISAQTASAGPVHSWSDDFVTNPLTSGWRLFGAPDLFQWGEAQLC